VLTAETGRRNGKVKAPPARSFQIRKRLLDAIAALAAVAAFSPVLLAQNTAQSRAAKAKATSATPDLSGVWEHHRSLDARSYVIFAFTQEELPMTPWAEAKYKTAKPSFGPHSFPIPETNDPVFHGCFPPGVPRIFLHPFPMEIVQAPDRVLMLFEYDQMRREIYTDGRPHDTSIGPTWMGDSIGHWEGDTLVVDTTNFNDKTWLDRIGHPHSDQLHLVERLRRVNHETLADDITIEDPKAYTKPWTISLDFKLRSKWKILEQFCEDNETFDELEKKETAPAADGKVP
jgi:hypothetical protein